MRTPLSFVSLFALALAACSTAPLPALPPPGEEATLFVHGYKGSFLAGPGGERIWLTPGAALSSGDLSLALPFAGARLGPHAPALHPDGPMTKLSVLGFGEDIYSGFLGFAAGALPGLVPYAYDWRDDVRTNAGALCALIAALPAQRVNLVVHSMGGLLTLTCLRQGAPKVRRVVFIATPFAGSTKIFKDFIQGDPVGRNRALLSAEALFTFASAFQLLPPAGDFFVDAAGAPAGLDAFNADLWTSRGLGPFADPQRRDDPAYRAQLARMIAAHVDLWRDLRSAAPGVPSLVILGTGHPTESAVRVGRAGFDLDHASTEDGDGTVTTASARPAFAHEEVVSREDHVGVLRDPVVQEAIARFLGGR